MKYKITCILLLLLLINCTKDKDDKFSRNETDIDLVTGINLRSSDISDAISLGNPNVWTNNQFIVYPNPTSEFLSITSTSTITDVWINAANANKIFQQTNFSTVLNTNLYTENQINSNSILSFNNLSNNNLAINLQDINPGYYKVFVKIEGIIYWDNIYVPATNFEITDLLSFWNK